MQTVAAQSAPGRTRAVLVYFTPGARTAWHTHPHGQILHILHGRARVCSAGGKITELGPGTTACFAAGEEHWHGASADQAMVHMAIQEADETGSTTDWGRHVSEREYAGD
jgi:quercetin dioxygenase-like cupin family protein